MEREELIARIKLATLEFIENDEILLQQDVHEEAISAKYLPYIEKYFADLELSIDSQYNRRFIEDELVRKQAEFLINTLPVKYWPKSWSKGQERVVKEILPDIIIHDRRNSGNNFLIIEIKKSTNKNKDDRQWDRIKLEEMTSRDLNYKYGLFIDLKTGVEFDSKNPFSATLFVKGKEILKL
jgi:hypothetical protein